MAAIEEIRKPPPNIRRNFYMFDSRVPPTWSEWVEREIASPAWLFREIARFFIVFLLVPLLFGKLAISALTAILLMTGTLIIVLAQGYLRRIALEFQRYGPDWSQSPYLKVGRYANIALALVFSVLFILLTRLTYF